MLNKLPNLVYADSAGKLYVHPRLKMCGMSGRTIRLPLSEEIIPLPKGSTFYFLPQRYPFGFDPLAKRFEAVEKIDGVQVFTTSCFTVPTYIRLLVSAYWLKKEKQPKLPLWAYSALGYYGGRFWTASVRTDTKNRQLPHQYSCEELACHVKGVLKLFPKNRLVQHLAYCALHYSCLAAKNFFYGRWEAPLPASRYCNSGCLGCLSLQEDEGIASHRRIGFTPSSEELAEVALYHIGRAPRAIVSFGQGCEGEPLLAYKVITGAIRLIRRQTSKGTINLNTNASVPKFLAEVIDAGLDSMRVSLNSAQERFYRMYFRPRGYSFKKVVQSILLAKKNKAFVSVNYLVFPGFTDTSAEIAAFKRFIRETRLNMVQLKNLNIDPEVYSRHGFLKDQNGIGIKKFIENLQSSFPRLKLSYFNIPKEEFCYTE